MSSHSCPICSAATSPAGARTGQRTGRSFRLRRCEACGFRFVEDPWTDYAQIYDEAYYAGQGSDPLVDYAFEFDQPQATVRQYEWRGLRRILGSQVAASGKFLDFGCGNGGLVRFLRASGLEVYGFDTGAWAEKARASGLAILNEEELAAHEGSFDAVTAIEVIEHVTEPIPLLRRLRRLLKPGGLLLLTTGNADRAPRDFASWGYVRPEIHVSYFTTRALALALEKAGFERVSLRRAPGWSDVIRFKLLKNLRIRKTNALEKLMPWPVVARILDWKYGLTAHPAGRAV